MELKARIANSIQEIDIGLFENADPFSSFDYLLALEKSDCLGAKKGWQVSHLLAMNGENQIGFCPLYLKYHSQGEYVFDYMFADALHRAGGEYYPKLLSAIPFTPVVGPRILAKHEETRAFLLNAMKQIAHQNALSSVHINFFDPQMKIELEKAGYLIRTDRQFWWENKDYSSFDDFLSHLSSSRRKSIKRERRDVSAHVEIRTIEGNHINESHMDSLYSFISDTYSRKWGNGVPYLMREFFSEILQTMREKIVLFFAFENDKPIAGAINFLGEGVLYGRQWGCLKDVSFLHFELCYYQAIEYAISRGIKRVEAGTQGEHKFARGYMPHKTYSAHYFTNPQLHAAAGDYFARETKAVEAHLDELVGQSPFKIPGYLSLSGLKL